MGATVTVSPVAGGSICHRTSPTSCISNEPMSTIGLSGLLGTTTHWLNTCSSPRSISHQWAPLWVALEMADRMLGRRQVHASQSQTVRDTTNESQTWSKTASLKPARARGSYSQTLCHFAKKTTRSGLREPPCPSCWLEGAQPRMAPRSPSPAQMRASTHACTWLTNQAKWRGDLRGCGPDTELRPAN